MERKVLLQEDDAAPDARDYFLINFEKKFGISLEEWRKKPTTFHKEVDELTTVWFDQSIQLTYAGDSPWYVVEEYDGRFDVKSNPTYPSPVLSFWTSGKDRTKIEGFKEESWDEIRIEWFKQSTIVGYHSLMLYLKENFHPPKRKEKRT